MYAHTRGESSIINSIYWNLCVNTNYSTGEFARCVLPKYIVKTFPLWKSQQLEVFYDQFINLFYLLYSICVFCNSFWMLLPECFLF